ncbi:MAG: phospholipase D family protein [Victivallales bacterium]|nr:phospholipase D family protein [Victivallales bacterium]
MNQFISNHEIYDKVICALVPQAKNRLWIATADIKDMYVASPGSGEMIPFLGLLDQLLAQGVDIRLIHAKEPGPNFRQDFDRYPRLWKQMERIICPRVHFKCIIADGRKAYFGSANLTGAGLGAKSDNRRNFENGVLTDDPSLVEPLCEQFDAVWRGACCAKCTRKAFCGDGPVNA